jgi:hypothetical protein
MFVDIVCRYKSCVVFFRCIFFPFVIISEKKRAGLCTSRLDEKKL